MGSQRPRYGHDSRTIGRRMKSHCRRATRVCYPDKSVRARLWRDAGPIPLAKPANAMTTTATDPLARQRNLILGLLVLLAAVAWGLLVWQATMPGMAAMGAEVGAALFLALWVVMMVAMMFPTAAPMILLFHRIQAKRRSTGQAFVATWIFVAAYLALWSGAGVVAYLAALAGEALLRQAGVTAETTARIGGGLLVIAGLYQVTPLKDVCLS